MSAMDNRDTASPIGFAQGLADAARENPLSTALIGMGALWLFMGGSRISIFGDVRDTIREGSRTTYPDTQMREDSASSSFTPVFPMCGAVMTTICPA